LPATLIAPAGGNAAPPVDKAKVQVVANPFTRAATEHVEPFDDRSIVVQAAAPTTVGPIDIPAFGYLRHVLLLVQATGGVGGGATVAAHEDSPWRAIRDIQITDVNGTPIIGPISGYELYLINKWGAYNFDQDMANSPAFGAVVAGAGASGNFSWLLRIPVEIAERDGLGALPNMNSSSTYKLWLTVAPGTEIYTVAPATTLPTVRVRSFLEAWAQPPQADLRGMPNMTTPPAMGTTQYWSKSVFNINAGDQRLRLTRVGNLIRNILFVFRNATPVRNSTNFPDPVRIEWDGKILFNEAALIWQHYMRERNMLTADTGVFAYQCTHDMDYKPGNEMRDLYIPTTQASRLELVGTFGVAGTLTVLTNDVAPAGDVFTNDF
jgi:hypothetical protein